MALNILPNNPAFPALRQAITTTGSSTVVYPGGISLVFAIAVGGGGGGGAGGGAEHLNGYTTTGAGGGASGAGVGPNRAAGASASAGRRGVRAHPTVGAHRGRRRAQSREGGPRGAGDAARGPGGRLVLALRAARALRCPGGG